MSKFMTEILKEINEDPKKLENYRNYEPLRMVVNFAFRPEGKFELPEGDPPFKPDAAPMGMSPANFIMEIKKWYIFTRKDLKPTRREQLFIQLLETVHPDEAKILLAVKDQNLTKLYKKITHKLVYEAGFIPNPPPEKPVKAKKDGASTRAES